MMDYRENAGYIITDSCHVGDSEFVLGVHLTAPQQFVTWKCSNRTDYDWGHYFSDLFSAQKDLVARAQEEVQCLEEQRQNTIAPEAPPYSPWGKVQECETLCPGVYSVSTPGHGGVMVRRELAEKVFRKEAMGCGFIASGYREMAQKLIDQFMRYGRPFVDSDHAPCVALRMYPKEAGNTIWLLLLSLCNQYDPDKDYSAELKAAKKE